jgi:hypothetical protein
VFRVIDHVFLVSKTLCFQEILLFHQEGLGREFFFFFENEGILGSRRAVLENRKLCIVKMCRVANPHSVAFW